MPRMRKSPHPKTASLSKWRRFLSKCHCPLGAVGRKFLAVPGRTGGRWGSVGTWRAWRSSGGIKSTRRLSENWFFHQMLFLTI